MGPAPSHNTFQLITNHMLIEEMGVKSYISEKFLPFHMHRKNLTFKIS